MSDKTLRAVEEAIRLHILDELNEEGHPRKGKGDIVVDWLAAVTVSNIIDVEGKDIVGYANRLIKPEGNPNAHYGLAMWMSEDMNDIIHPPELEED